MTADIVLSCKDILSCVRFAYISIIREKYERIYPTTVTREEHKHIIPTRYYVNVIFDISYHHYVCLTAEKIDVVLYFQLNEHTLEFLREQQLNKYKCTLFMDVNSCGGVGTSCTGIISKIDDKYAELRLAGRNVRYLLNFLLVSTPEYPYSISFRYPEDVCGLICPEKSYVSI